MLAGEDVHQFHVAAFGRMSSGPFIRDLFGGTLTDVLRREIVQINVPCRGMVCDVVGSWPGRCRILEDGTLLLSHQR
jgi:hypothetical protein